MAEATRPGPIVKYFGDLEDPRIERAKGHDLLDTIAITLCVVVCGADNWVEIEEFGKAKRDWFAGFLKLPNGIPSHDTFGRVFGLLEPERFAECFSAWVGQVANWPRVKWWPLTARLCGDAMTVPKAGRPCTW